MVFSVWSQDYYFCGCDCLEEGEKPTYDLGLTFENLEIVYVKGVKSDFTLAQKVYEIGKNINFKEKLDDFSRFKKIMLDIDKTSGLCFQFTEVQLMDLYNEVTPKEVCAIPRATNTLGDFFNKQGIKFK